MISSTFSPPQPSRSMPHKSSTPIFPSLSSTPEIHLHLPQPRLSPRSPPLPTPTATLIVGGPTSPSREPHPTKFAVPIHLLISCSPFFAACLRSPTAILRTSIWTEARTGVIRLPTERVEDIGMLTGWLEGESGIPGVDVGVGILERERDVDGDRYEDQDGDVTKISGLKVWRDLCRMQPGLRHEAIDGAVEQYLYWKSERLRRKAMKKESKTVKRKMGVEGVRTTCYGSVSDVFSVPEATPDSENNAPETLVDADTIEIEEMKSECESTSFSMEHDNQSSHADTLALTTAPPPSPRPPPPILGPLIRLYILADKYDIGYPSNHLSSPPSTANDHLNPNADLTLPSHVALRHALTLRLKTIHTLTHTVPHWEDIARLWSSVPVDVLREQGLKAEIVRMFVGIRGREIGRIFADENWDAEFLRSVLVGRAEREMEKGEEVKDVK